MRSLRKTRVNLYRRTPRHHQRIHSCSFKHRPGTRPSRPLPPPIFPPPQPFTSDFPFSSQFVCNVVLLRSCRTSAHPLLSLAEHLTAHRAWCTSNVRLVGEDPTWFPSRHCRDARVHGHTVRLQPCMIMNTTPPPPCHLPPPRLTLYKRFFLFLAALP